MTSNEMAPDKMKKTFDEIFRTHSARTLSLTKLRLITHNNEHVKHNTQFKTT
jgi:hypothetical protein